MKAQVSIIMGSTSDLPVMEKAAKILNDFKIPFEMNALSAHRTPEEVEKFAREAAGRGIRVIIAAAGMAAHRHGLYREIVYKRIAPRARVELHGKAGAALEGGRAEGHAVSPAELASHFELAREPIRALRYYDEAAEAAADVAPAVAGAEVERELRRRDHCHALALSALGVERYADNTVTGRHRIDDLLADADRHRLATIGADAAGFSRIHEAAAAAFGAFKADARRPPFLPEKCG